MFFGGKKSYRTGPSRCDRVPRDSNLIFIHFLYVFCCVLHVETVKSNHGIVPKGDDIGSIGPQRFAPRKSPPLLRFLRHGAMAEFHHPNVPENEAETSDDFDG